MAGITFVPTSPPTPDCVAKASAAMATDQLLRVDPAVMPFFAEAAQELLDSGERTPQQVRGSTGSRRGEEVGAGERKREEVGEHW